MIRLQWIQVTTGKKINTMGITIQCTAQTADNQNASRSNFTWV
jgi:hypothetical protein